jgi:pentose-5-phosphate-3-epimerase
VALGANVLVAASAVFNEHGSIAENIRALRDSVAALQA